MNGEQFDSVSRARRHRHTVALVTGFTLTVLSYSGACAQIPRQRLFDGKTLNGWEALEGERHLWTVTEGTIAGGSLKERIAHNSFLATKRSFHNFDLRLKMRITGTEGFVNSGVQIRSVRIPGSHEMIGYQVDAGKGWWGKLYDESRRKRVVGQAADLAAVEKAVNGDGWNEYRIRAEGQRIRSWINGVPALDYTETDAGIALDGRIGIQVHGGGKALVHVKDVTIEELPATPGATTWKKVGLPKPRRLRAGAKSAAGTRSRSAKSRRGSSSDPRAGPGEQAPPRISEEDAFKSAAMSAEVAGYSISKVQRWLHERALKDIDPETGLYRTRGRWNYWDTAADCYPFLCWAAWLVDPEALDGPVRNVLHVEQELCNHLDRLPTRWDFGKNAKDESISHDRLIFGASEYVKDGLIAIVEVTGKDDWFERMKGIEEDVWKHARVDTPYGKIPSTNVEVNGEQLQALTRLYTMTGDHKFLTWARRLGDYYLKNEDFVPTRLRDHGCEIIGGLGLLLGVESSVNPARARQMLPPLKKMFDEILARGCNEDGIMYNTLGRGGRLSDGWGYNYVGFLCYDMVAEKPLYRGHIEKTLRNLAKPRYESYPWEGKSIDGYADSIEGALYVLNRLPVPEGFAWVDREMAKHVARSSEPLETANLWGTMKLESNGVRTVILHGLKHTRGLRALPWRQDLRLGACQTGDALALVLKTGKAWSGRLIFDIPRHRLVMGFRKDWPRMNTVPEWFTVEPDKQYTVEGLPGGTRRFSGQQLHDGLSVTSRPGTRLRLKVAPRAAARG